METQDWGKGHIDPFWDNEYKKLNIDWQDHQLARQTLSENPKLLERPIIILEHKAIIARPPEILEDFLS